MIILNSNNNYVSNKAYFKKHKIYKNTYCFETGERIGKFSNGKYYYTKYTAMQFLIHKMYYSLLFLMSQMLLTLINNETILWQILSSDTTSICSQEKQHFRRILPNCFHPRLIAKIQSSYLACNPVKQLWDFSILTVFIIKN